MCALFCMDTQVHTENMVEGMNGEPAFTEHVPCPAGRHCSEASYISKKPRRQALVSIPLFQMWNGAWDMGLMIDKLKRQRLTSGSVNNPLKGCEVEQQQRQHLPSLWELVPRV